MDLKDSDQPSKSEHHKRWIACPIEEEYFGSNTRKAGRQQRKLATQRDRSKYKKTDAKMLAKEEAPSEDKNLSRGRVLSITSRGIIVDCEGKTLTCFLRGALKKEKTLHKNLVTVGDFVLFEEIADSEGYITYVEPRRTILSRADNLSRKKQQLIAANIDQVIITVSVVSPPLKPPLIDRYMIATRKGGMEPILVINKADLIKNLNFDSSIREYEADLLEKVIDAYQRVNILVIETCADTGQGIKTLKEAMKNKASVFSGQSGVGKSSLINATTGLNLPVGEVVDRTRKGAHTTTTAQLIRLDCGGFCIDTPGIKSFGVWDLEPEDIKSYFTEINALGNQCKFHNCTHTHEGGCAIAMAAEEGVISALRYESYKSLMAQAREEHKRR